MNVIRGLNDVEGHKIYINRGVGNVLFPLRFCSLPEIAFIEI
jgi:predicted MPP superfamily phosphohydrolase